MVGFIVLNYLKTIYYALHGTNMSTMFEQRKDRAKQWNNMEQVYGKGFPSRKTFFTSRLKKKIVALILIIFGTIKDYVWSYPLIVFFLTTIDFGTSKYLCYPFALL